MDFRFTLSHTPKQAVTRAIDLPDNSVGENVGPEQGGGLPNINEWTVGSVPSVNLPGEGLIAATQTSRIYAIDFTFSTGLEYQLNYSINYDIGADTSGRFVEFVVLDGADNILFNDQKVVGSGAGTLSSSSSFTAPAGAVKYGFWVQITNTAPNVGGSDFEIQNNITGTASTQAEPGNTTSQIISEPDGWKGCKLILERHDDFHSLIEHYDGGAGGAFIFYGNNGVENGGIDYLKHLEYIYGFNVQVDILTEFSFDETLYEEIFRGQVDISAKDEMVDNVVKAPIIRDDLWTKFITRRDTQVDLSSNVDLDGNIVDAVTPVSIVLTPQVIRQEYTANQKDPSQCAIENEATYPYIWFDLSNSEQTEIEEKYILPFSFMLSRPSQFAVKYGGEYTFDVKYCVTVMFADPDTLDRGLFNISGAWLFDVFIQINDQTPIQFTQTNFGNNISGAPTDNDRWSEYTYSGTHNLNPGDSIRVYGLVPANGMDFIFPNAMLAVLGNESGILDWTGMEPSGGVDVNFGPVDQIDTHFYLTADTTYPETVAQGYLIHDLLYGITQRICGRGIYSEFLGSTYTNMRQYPIDGCGASYVIIKGLQLRDYTLSEKPFFASFNQIWNGIHKILCLGLSYEDMDDSPAARLIRIEQMDHFFSDDVSINFSNVRDIRSYYDRNRIFKVIRSGFKKWESDDVSGLDDPQTKRTYATIFDRIGEELNIESEFIAGSLTIDITRRSAFEKSSDYKYDNDNFIIAINPNDVSPDRYVPELDENFDQVTGIISPSTRYNLILTPMRSLLRWAKFIGGCMQPYLNSYYRFVSGEGNYNMLTDYSCTTGNQCQAIICDALSERQDISLQSYNSVFGYLHLAQECEMTIPMTKNQYDIINNNRKKSIGISQTDSNFTKFKIKKLEFDLIKGEATIKAWPKTFFSIQVIDDPIEMPNCEPETAECLGSDLRLTEDSEFRVTEDGECRELELIN